MPIRTKGPRRMSGDMTIALARSPVDIRWQARELSHTVTETPPRDADLARRVASSDESALEIIYRAHGGAVKAIARRVLNDDTLAEDVVQDVFVSFWKAPDRYDPSKGSLRTYLLTIAHRRAVDTVRSEVARSAREERYRSTRADNRPGDGDMATFTVRDGAWRSRRPE